MTTTEVIAACGALIAMGGVLHKMVVEHASNRAVEHRDAAEGRLANRDQAHREAVSIWDDAAEWRVEQANRILTLETSVKERDAAIVNARSRIECLEKKVSERDAAVAELRGKLAMLIRAVKQWQQASCSVECDRRLLLIPGVRSKEAQ